MSTLSKVEATTVKTFRFSVVFSRTLKELGTLPDSWATFATIIGFRLWQTDWNR